MRCNNCGWTNPEGISKCQKCNQTLVASEPSTPKEVVNIPTNGESVGRCLKCGYLLIEAEDFCPNCGYRKMEVPRTEEVETASVQNRKTVVLNHSFNFDDIQEESKIEHRKEEENLTNAKTIVKDTVRCTDIVSNQEKHIGEVPNDKATHRTVIDISQNLHPKHDTRKTVVDTADFISSVSNVSPEDNREADKKNFQYKLTCIDDSSSKDIVMSASSELSIKEDDIILIGGLRYRAN